MSIVSQAIEWDASYLQTLADGGSIGPLVTRWEGLSRIVEQDHDKLDRTTRIVLAEISRRVEITASALISLESQATTQHDDLAKRLEEILKIDGNEGNDNPTRIGAHAAGRRPTDAHSRHTSIADQPILRRWFYHHLPSPYPTPLTKNLLATALSVPAKKVESDLTNWRRRSGWVDVCERFASGDRDTMRLIIERIIAGHPYPLPGDAGEEAMKAVVGEVDKVRRYARGEDVAAGEWLLEIPTAITTLDTSPDFSHILQPDPEVLALDQAAAAAEAEEAAKRAGPLITSGTALSATANASASGSTETPITADAAAEEAGPSNGGSTRKARKRKVLGHSVVPGTGDTPKVKKIRALFKFAVGFKAFGGQFGGTHLAPGVAAGTSGGDEVEQVDVIAGGDARAAKTRKVGKGKQPAVPIQPQAQEQAQRQGSGSGSGDDRSVRSATPLRMLGASAAGSTTSQHSSRPASPSPIAQAPPSGFVYEHFIPNPAFAMSVTSSASASPIDTMRYTPEPFSYDMPYTYTPSPTQSQDQGQAYPYPYPYPYSTPSPYAAEGQRNVSGSSTFTNISDSIPTLPLLPAPTDSGLPQPPAHTLPIHPAPLAEAYGGTAQPIAGAGAKRAASGPVQGRENGAKGTKAAKGKGKGKGKRTVSAPTQDGVASASGSGLGSASTSTAMAESEYGQWAPGAFVAPPPLPSYTDNAQFASTPFYAGEFPYGGDNGSAQAGPSGTSHNYYSSGTGAEYPTYEQAYPSWEAIVPADAIFHPGTAYPSASPGQSSRNPQKQGQVQVGLMGVSSAESIVPVRPSPQPFQPYLPMVPQEYVQAQMPVEQPPTAYVAPLPMLDTATTSVKHEVPSHTTQAPTSLPIVPSQSAPATAQPQSKAGGTARRYMNNRPTLRTAAAARVSSQSTQAAAAATALPASRSPTPNHVIQQSPASGVPATSPSTPPRPTGRASPSPVATPTAAAGQAQGPVTDSPGSAYEVEHVHLVPATPSHDQAVTRPVSSAPHATLQRSGSVPLLSAPGESEQLGPALENGVARRHSAGVVGVGVGVGLGVQVSGNAGEGEAAVERERTGSAGDVTWTFQPAIWDL